jgi:hypothetical protein
MSSSIERNANKNIAENKNNKRVREYSLAANEKKPLEQDIGRQSATVPGTKFYGAGTPGPRAAGPGVNMSGNDSEAFTPRTVVTMAIHPSSGPDIIRSWPSDGQENTEGRCTGAGRPAAGRTNIASGLFVNGRGQRKRGTCLEL